MSKITSLALLLLLLVPVASAAPEAEALLDGFQRWLDGTRDLSGSFEQELLSGALGTGAEERGRWYVRRPGQLRFDYRSPENKVALVNGTETLLWIEADDYTEQGRVDPENDLLVSLLTGEVPLRDLFLPGLDLEPVRRGQARLRLVPARESEAFTELILTLPSDGAGLEAIEVLDAAGNRMLYRFPKVRRNTGVPAEKFRFTAP